MGQQHSQTNIIADKYTDYGQIVSDLKSLGVSRFQSLFFIDFSVSNNIRNNHNADLEQNPYYKILTAIEKIIKDFDSDQIFPTYRFGCQQSKDHCVLPLAKKESDCGPEQPHECELHGFRSVIIEYQRACKNITKSGPTSLNAAFDKSVEYS